MLRTVLVVLLLVNALFFGWTRGWFGAAWPPPGESQREPERIAAQVRPDRMVLLNADAARAALRAPPAPATAAVEAGASASTAAAGTAASADAGTAGATAAAETQCLEAGPFTADQLVAANKLLTRAGVDLAALTDVPLATPGWMVFAGRFADAAARRTRLQAWQRQGVPAADPLEEPRELAPGLVFSRHSSRAEAEAALAALAGRHPAVATVARVVQGPEGSVRLSRLRVAAAPATLALKLREAALPPAQRFTRCAPA